MTAKEPAQAVEKRIAVELAGITKRYPRVIANDNASLVAREGEVHAVVGENGAGKSTLMKILYGLIPLDSGRIQVKQQTLHSHTPKEAIALGVGMVFQHFMLVPALSVAENIVLGREKRRGLSFDRRRAEEEVAEVSLRYGLTVDPRARVADCSVGLQQRVEILKVLYRGAEVIILDEPTAVLTPQEVDELITVMRSLAESGKTILLITHKLREVMAASDRITVMQKGRTVATLETQNTSAPEVAEIMVGRAIVEPKRSLPRAGQVLLSVERLSARSDRGLPALHEVSLTVRTGEILGIAGIEGNGQTELIECIAGLRPASSGAIHVAGRDVLLESVMKRLEAGLAHIPEDRHKRAVVLELSVEENSILGSQRSFSAFGRMLWAAIKEHAQAIILECDVRPPDGSQVIAALSGGNQQKVVIGREMRRRPKLLLAAHPTRGLDVGAIEFVDRALLDAKQNDAAVVLVSGELKELLALSDRLLVIFGGRIVGEIDPATVDERRLGLLMAGQG